MTNTPSATPSADTIIVIEDDKTAAQTFQRILELAGYRVETAPTGEMGLAVIERTVPAAVLLDLHLPLGHGLDVLRRLRSHPRCADVPVAIVTGDYFIEDETAHELEQLAAQVYFKPLWAEDLLRVAQTLVGQGRVSLPPNRQVHL